MIHLHFQGENAAGEAASFIEWLETTGRTHLLSGASLPASVPLPTASGAPSKAVSAKNNPWEDSPAVKVFRRSFPGETLRPAGDENRHQTAMRRLREKRYDTSIFPEDWKPSGQMAIPEPEAMETESAEMPDGADMEDI